ncbi:MAG: InlB B-repeat-containing protein [Firmicutes bacterium]|nr:InlB B-repeat-containing protein [Bacillota bacterium]
MKKRLLSILLTLCMALSLLPAVAFAEGGAKAIQSGTGSIHGYDTSAGGYSYIYYGTWRNSPIKWRVLDTKANTGAADALFLLTDECLYPLPGDLYACYIQFNPADKQNRHLWKDSTLQNWFQNTFYSGENSAFTSAERALIPATTQEGSMYTLSNLHMRLQICALEAEYVFAPSIQDIMNADYGFTDAASRIAGPINSLGPGTRYWLRSFEISEQLPFMVGEDASLMGDWGDNPSAVRPAMNLSTAGNNILFVSAAEGGKPAGGLAEISEYTGNEWKLTLLDSSRSGFAVTTTDLSAYTRGGTVKIAYTGAKTGTNEYVSAMILDAAGNPAYYGRSSAALTDENGTAELTIPALAEGTYTLKVFNEQYNGDKMTDLASAFADVTLTVEEGVEEQFTLTPGGRYYFDLSAMNIPGTANRDLPDSTLHYVPFTYVGTVDAYKLTSAMATTEEYAQQNKYAHSLFVADYAVTHKVNWNNLDTASLIFGKNYASGGVDYTLRAPSVGSNSTGSGDSQRGVPQSNEWDTMLNKNSGYIQNWIEMYSWGQDAYSTSYRAVRGCYSARHWDIYYATISYPIVGFRPVLEVLNPDTLGPYGMKAVTLDLGGGTLGGSSGAIQIIVKNGSAFTAPASDGLTRPAGDTDNYFMWLDGNGNSYEPGGSVPADVTELTVQWTAPIYAVTLNTNGGTINNGNVTEYIYGVGATLPTADDMTYTGHTFKGWYDNEGLTGDPVTAIGGTEMGNKEYWAKWEINQYTITFDTAGGSAIAPITQDYGTAITAPADPTREGYTFAGWDTAIPATMPAHNMTITAQWTVNQYTIIYDLDGGTAEGNPDTYTVETDAFTLKNPTRPGHTFTGWSGTGLTGEDNLTLTIPKGSTGNRSYTAHWSLNTYSITYDLNGGTASGNPTSYTVESATITLNQPTKTGYTFTGWSGTDLTGEDNLTVTIPAGSTGDRSYTAHWSLNTYSITYDLDGGTASGNPDFYTVESSTITLNPPTRTGYTFIGWSGTDLSGSDNLTVTIPTGSIGNRSYTAHWSLNTYSITYDLDGGTALGNPDFYTVESSAITLNEPTKAGYVFTGWSGTDLVGEDNLRGMLVTILYRMENEPRCFGSAAFSDVKPGAYYEKAVVWASQNNIVSGYTDGTFRPDAPVTREQLASILYRYTRYRGQDVSAAGTTSLTGYGDAQAVSNYALPAMRWACGMGILQGANGKLNPNGLATRAQLAAMLHRYLTK